VAASSGTVNAILTMSQAYSGVYNGTTQLPVTH
jgi:hypothetical protein